MKPRNGKHFHQSKYAKACRREGGVEVARREVLWSLWAGQVALIMHAPSGRSSSGSSSNNIQKLMACNYLLQWHEA